MTHIRFNDQDYNLEQLIRIHTEGAHIKLTPDIVLIEGVSTQTVSTMQDYIAVAGSAGLRVLVKPTDTTKAKGVYVLSKYIMKKALTTTRYTSVEAPRERSDSRRSYQNRNDSRSGDRRNYSAR